MWEDIIKESKGDENISEILAKKNKVYQQKCKDLVFYMCEQLESGPNLLMIDKCNNGLRALKDFKDYFPKYYNINVKKNKTKVICLVPSCKSYLNSNNKNNKWAPSLSLIFTALYRVLNRENHIVPFFKLNDTN